MNTDRTGSCAINAVDLCSMAGHHEPNPTHDGARYMINITAGAACREAMG